MTRQKAKKLVEGILPPTHAVCCSSAVIIKGGSAIAVYATSESEMPKLFLVDDDLLMTFKWDSTTTARVQA